MALKAALFVIVGLAGCSGVQNLYKGLDQMAQSSGYAYRTTYSNGAQVDPYRRQSDDYGPQVNYLPPQYYLQPPPFIQQQHYPFKYYPYYNNINNYGSQYGQNYLNGWAPGYSPQYNHYDYAHGAGARYDGTKNAVQGDKGESNYQRAHSYDKGNAGEVTWKLTKKNNQLKIKKKMQENLKSIQENYGQSL